MRRRSGPFTLDLVCGDALHMVRPEAGAISVGVVVGDDPPTRMPREQRLRGSRADSVPAVTPNDKELGNLAFAGRELPAHREASQRAVVSHEEGITVGFEE